MWVGVGGAATPDLSDLLNNWLALEGDEGEGGSGTGQTSLSRWHDAMMVVAQGRCSSAPR